MNKIVGIFAAVVLAAGCFSCSDKNKDQKPEEKPAESKITVSDSTEGVLETPVETVKAEKKEFREYSEDEFRTVNVNITKSDKEPPFTLHSLNTSALDFGEIIPCCKQGEYRDRYKPDFSYEENEEYRQNSEAEWEKVCTEPTKGTAISECCCGNELYYVVSYDTYCLDNGGWDNYHEWGIFHVDGLTGKTEELFHYSDPEKGMCVYSIYMFRDRLYLSIKEKGIMYLDNGKLVEMGFKGLETNYFWQNDGDRLIVYGRAQNYQEVNEDYEGKSGEIVEYYEGKKSIYLGYDWIIYEYDTNTDKWNELYSGSVAADGTGDAMGLYGRLFAWVEKPEGSRKYDAVTEEYRLSTGLTACEIIYADSNELVVHLGSRSNKNVIHCFDIVEKVHYVLDCTSLSPNSFLMSPNCDFKSCGLLLYPSGNGGTLYYIMPEYGLTFPVFKSDFIEKNQNDGYFTTMQSGGNVISFEQGVVKNKVEHRDEDGNVYFTDFEYDVTRYWINGDEING